MKKIVLLLCLVSFIAVSCHTGHKAQSWHPRTGKKMKRGHNH